MKRVSNYAALPKHARYIGSTDGDTVNQHTGNMRHYLSSPHGYGCAIVGPV